MELALTSWHISSMTSSGIESMMQPQRAPQLHMAASSGTRRYTCAEDSPSTWNLGVARQSQTQTRTQTRTRTRPVKHTQWLWIHHPQRI